MAEEMEVLLHLLLIVEEAVGGATHIATTNRGVLANYNSFRNEILIVAGGGRRRRKPINWRSRPEEQMEFSHQLQHSLVVGLQAGGGSQTAGGANGGMVVTTAGFGVRRCYFSEPSRRRPEVAGMAEEQGTTQQEEVAVQDA